MFDVGKFLMDVATGDVAAKGENKRVQQDLARLEKIYGDIATPELGPINLANQVYEGDVTPELIGDVKDLEAQQVDPRLQGESEMKGIETDPRLKDAQMAALLELQGISDNGGMSAQEEADLARIQSQADQADRGRRDAIKQNMAARGMGGSGMELLAQLQSSQAATDRQAQQGLDVAAMAQQRALQALMESGNLSGKLRGQDFEEQSRVAAAQDAINRFNTSTANQGMYYNADSQMNADQFNIGNDFSARSSDVNAINNSAFANRDARQNVSNANVNTQNQQTMTNQIDIPQQNFNNQMSVADGKSGAISKSIDVTADRAKDKREGIQNIIAGGAKIAASSA